MNYLMLLIVLHFDFNFYTTWEVKFHKCIDSLCSCIENINKTLIRRELELLT